VAPLGCSTGHTLRYFGLITENLIVNFAPTTRMGEIEKVGDLESQNLGIKNCLRNTSIEKFLISLVKISPFRMKKSEINELIRNETFFQQSVFEMSHFDIVKAKNLILALFYTKISHYSII
jgi:hypothetical protein